MAKQTFTTGSVLTATQMNNLNQNDYNWSVDGKVASYVLVAADAGKRIEMNSGSATTITVNTGLFTAGDMVYLSNIGSGTCTITAGTATVNKSTNASLALGQYQSGMLYFVSASSSIFYPFDIGSAAASSTSNFSLLGTGTLSGSATITVSGISGMNKLYVLCESNGTGGNANAQILLRLNADNAGNYFYQGPSIRPPATITSSDFTFQQTLGDTSILLTTKSTNSASVFSFGAMIEGCNSTGLKMITTTGAATASGGNNNQLNTLQGYWNNTATVTSVSIISSAGNFTGGTFKVYGSAV